MKARDIKKGDPCKGGVVTFVAKGRNANAGRIRIQYSYPYSPAGVKEFYARPNEEIEP